MDYFVKYRREWLSQYDNNMILVYAYLYRFCSIEHIVSFTIKDMVSYFGFKSDRNRGRINDQFKLSINRLIDLGYLTFIGCYSDDEIKSFVDGSCSNKDVKYMVKDNQMLSFKLDNFDADDYWNPGGNFVKFTYHELDKIRNLGSYRLDKLVATYLNIKKWISASDCVSGIYIAYPSESKLARDIGCNTKSVQEYVNNLVSFGLIYKANYGSYKRLLKGEIIKQNANTVYALDKKYLDGKYDKNALIQYLKSSYQMIDDDFEPFNQPINQYQQYHKIDDDEVSLIAENNWGVFGVDYDELFA